MLFDDLRLTPKKRVTVKERPPVPDTGWKPPAYYPELRDASLIAIDTETKELDFDSGGPGWARKAGWIVGVSVAANWSDGRSYRAYFPVRHEEGRDWNLDPVHTFDWLRAMLHTPTIPKIGANLLYDIGWLTEENIFVQGELHDVQYAESLLDDEAPVNLDFLADKYLRENKLTGELYTWLQRAYGGAINGKQRGNIWRAPPMLVGPYAEADADLPMRIIPHQWIQMQSMGLLPVYRLECDLIPLLIKMRRQGMPIDVDYAHRLYDELKSDILSEYDKLAHMTGVRIESTTKQGQLVKVFDAVGIKYPMTQAINPVPSFQKEWLKALDNPVGKQINAIRELEQLRGTFVGSSILDKHVNGVVHAQLHQLRNDEGGTKTGRLSSSVPNLQNVPQRTVIGKRVRRAFTKFNGHKCFNKRDYSQIEYRMLAHFAVGAGSDELRYKYNNDPDTDYHDNVYYALCDLRSYDKTDKALRTLWRTPIKNVNFGLAYGQSEKALAYKAGFTNDEAAAFFIGYHKAAPYVAPTLKAIAAEAGEQGYITTLLGRRTRFDLWEPARNFKKLRPLPYQQALAAYGSDLARAYLYRAVNYRFQGSGTGDVIKAAMLACDKSGVFDFTGVPLMQVHDELDFSIPDDTPAMNEAFRFITYTMETATVCKVPIKVDSKNGPTWGDIG